MGELDQHSVLIPPSAFIMGTDVEPFYGTILPQSKEAKVDEGPIRVVFLEPYRIDRYPVTNVAYGAFVNATGHRAPPHWKKGQFSAEVANLPVVHVSWHDATAYAQWVGARLPVEAEWEKAARGADGRIYPWGNQFDSAQSNQDGNELTEKSKRTGDSQPNPESELMEQVLTSQLTPVGSRPTTVSPYGVHDVAGNVWEWTADWYNAYQGNLYKSRDYGEKDKVLRGGSWLEVRDRTAKRYFRCANRLHAPPDYTGSNIGFRCVREVTPEEAQTYKPQISVELLDKYVRQEQLKNLRAVCKAARKQSIQDFIIAAALIGAGCYGLMTPKYAIAGFTMEVLGAGFLFSTGVNFWRQWKAGKKLKGNRTERNG